ncbi:MAG: hypothetical protein HeimC2_36710 [Candidatus Heimdallarchaeota archaeon LC_2]|nr:MAG: hypothetical protein HeimC2_36710 [Candidatus Heimdallarchaeota archaeon LC_2]
MQAYPIAGDIYKIPGGFGGSGENYGGILISNTPPILIGASGTGTFVINLIEALDELGLHKKLKVFFPCVTWEEILTAEKIQKHLPDTEFHVHQDLWEVFVNPRDKFLNNRYYAEPSGDVRKLEKKLPKKLENVVKVNKLSNIETDKTKILVVPSSGPQKGHIFVYSRDHKLLCPGLVLGITPSNKNIYYIDKTGDFNEFKEALNFLSSANADIVAPVYGEPYFTSGSPISTFEVSSAMDTARDVILRLVSTKPESFNELFKRYYNTYAEKYNSSPYDVLKFNQTVFFMHLEKLVEDKLLNNESGQYRRM